MLEFSCNMPIGMWAEADKMIDTSSHFGSLKSCYTNSLVWLRVLI